MELTAALTTIGLGVIANLTTEPVKNLLQKLQQFFGSKDMEEPPLKDLFIQAFYQSLEVHEAHYDKSAQRAVKRLRAAVQKDEFKLLSIISRVSGGTDRFLSALKSGDFLRALAQEVAKDFNLVIQGRYREDLMTGVLSDCFRFYRNAFFKRMSEKQALQAILIESLKIDSILDLLNKLGSHMVTRQDFDDLKRVLFTQHYARHPEDHKRLEDYDEYIKKKFRFIELRGFSPRVSGKEIQMELEDIFVPLAIQPDRTGEPSDLDQRPGRVFRYDSDDEVDDDDEPDEDKAPSVDSIIRVLLTDNVVILGDPGSGKSTLLKYLARLAAGTRDSDHPLGHIIPVYFRIPEFALFLKNQGKNLYEFITHHFDSQYSDLFKEGFAFSNLLLLMDGLDEVIETPLRIRVTGLVEDLMARYPYNHYVVTSRIVGYRESRLGAGFKHFQLLPFGKNQITAFSRQWYRAIADHTDRDYKHAEDQAGSLDDCISRNPSVTRLASNPLLMTIIALIHYRGKKLPNKRIELYDISTETFLEHWVNVRMQLRLSETSQLKDKSEIIEIMAPIAFEIHETRPDGLMAEDEFREAFTRQYRSVYPSATLEKAKSEYKEFLQFLRQEAGFFYEKGENEQGQPLFGFIHLTFEEYFAALHLMGQWMEDKLDLKKYVFDPRWTEIIRLAAGQIRYAIKGQAGRGKAAEFVKDLLAVEDPFPEAFRPLQLVCLVLADDVSITEEMQTRVLDKMIEVYSTAGRKMLVGSFSRLFKELLSSEGREVYVERIKKELLSTGNTALRNNLAYILMDNSWDKSIRKFLTGLLKKLRENAEICRAIFSIDWTNYPLQRLSYFRDSFRDFLRSFYFSDGQGLPEDMIESFLEVIAKGWFFVLDKKVLGNMKKVFDSLYGTVVFEPLFLKLFENLFHNNMSWVVNKDHLKEFLKNYPGSPLAKNLYHLLYKGEFKRIKGSDSAVGVKLTNFRGYLIYSFLNRKKKPREFVFFYYSIDFSRFNVQRLKSQEEFFSEKEISRFLEWLRKDLPESEVEIVKNTVYDIMGLEGNKKQYVERFIQFHNSGYNFNSLGWFFIPFSHISSDSGVLSKFIAEKGEFYIDNYPTNFPLEGFLHPDVNPPARLLAYYLKKEPYDDKLVQESIAYYKNCPPEQKAGVFAILYKVLNRLE